MSGNIIAKKTILLCGHQSRYGLAHLKPILTSPEFDVQLIVLASAARWRRFRELTSPDEMFIESISRRNRIKEHLRGLRNFIQRTSVWPGSMNGTRKLVKKIPVKIVDDINDTSVVEELGAIEAKVLLSAAFPQIFSREIIACASEYSINFHPSALPRCRGAHPHFWSIASGEEIGGVTAHLLTEKIDAGDIVAQRVFPIDHLNYGMLYDRIIEETPALVRATAEFVVSQQHHTLPQDHLRATHFKNDRRIHRRIFWREQSARQIHNLSRTDMGFCFLQSGDQVMIQDAFVVPGNRNLHGDVRVEPGTIVDLKKSSIIVKALDNCIEIKRISLNGRRAPMHKWIKRRRLQIGQQLV